MSENSAPQENEREEFGSAEAGRKGGKARAKKLTDEEKREIARRGAMARWKKQDEKIPRATHEAVVRIGEIEIPCAVLDNGMRVLSQGAFMLAIGRSERPQAGTGSAGRAIEELPPFLSADNLKAFVTTELRDSTKPLIFKSLAGPKAFGYDAMLLPLVCEVYLGARREKKLRKQQEHIAATCEVLQSGFARVGIIALIDEATGYQYERPRRELEELLKQYLSESLRRYARTFPGDYFKHLCRLRGVEFRPDMRLPLYFGHLTNNLVYRRIAPGLLKALKERRIERGTLHDPLFSWLSEDVGLRALLVHLGTVTGLMKLHRDYDEYVRQLDQIAPVYPETPGLFDDPKDWDKNNF